MIVIANILIVLTQITLFLVPVVLMTVIVSYVMADSIVKDLSKHERTHHIVLTLIVPFGLGFWRYVLQTRQSPDVTQSPRWVRLRAISIRALLISGVLFFIMIALSLVLMIYFKYI